MIVARVSVETFEDVLRSVAAGESQRDIGARLGLCKNVVWRISSGQSIPGGAPKPRKEPAPRKTLAERFFEKVDINGPVPSHRPELGPCHLWRGGRSKRGYGSVYLNGKMAAASRVAFFLAYGYWPDQACHHCDNPPCVNSRHLFDGDGSANMLDCVSKGRHTAHLYPKRMARIGSTNGRFKLTDVVVERIRGELQTGCTHREAAKRLGISKTSVSRVARGEDPISMHRNESDET